MHLDQFAARLGAAIDIPAATIVNRARRLRDAKLFSKGVQGRGAHVSSADAVNLTLAGLIEHRYGADVVANVRRIRSLPLAEVSGIPDGFASCLSFTKGTVLADALVGLLDDIRSGLFRRFESQSFFPLQLSFFLDADNGEAGLSLYLSRMSEGGGSWSYRTAEPHRRTTWRHVNVRGELFFDLAEALGPPS
jgi:hypothetical protein